MWPQCWNQQWSPRNAVIFYCVIANYCKHGQSCEQTPIRCQWSDFVSSYSGFIANQLRLNDVGWSACRCPHHASGDNLRTLHMQKQTSGINSVLDISLAWEDLSEYIRKLWKQWDQNLITAGGGWLPSLIMLMPMQIKPLFTNCEFYGFTYFWFTANNIDDRPFDNKKALYCGF